MMGIRHSYGNRLSSVVPWLVYTYLLSKIPGGLGIRAKNVVLKSLLGHSGNGMRISTGVRMVYPQGISLGNNVGIAHDVTLDGRGGLQIGDDSIIGFESVVLTSTHMSKDKDVPIRKQGLFCAPVKLGKNVWAGARTIILPGVTVGDGTIIAANSVVSKSLPANTVYGGVPAHFIRKR